MDRLMYLDIELWVDSDVRYVSHIAMANKRRQTAARESLWWFKKLEAWGVPSRKGDEKWDVLSGAIELSAVAKQLL